ncbi:YjgN family protein [Oxalicibacterium solurbis]|uniref:Membrane protein n=1 Tax=Oxalicibacterium solurbis TaxID=69280 RepID=A0A8J3B1Y1_9BURK|nr:YjgN family protein [Oxalicibacterium solurbis]GGI53355.1 membrane protein [Oxalicibacterium solurbis]
MIEPSASAVPASPFSDEPQRFTFSGTGSEYFRIWIVNLLLSVVTLGIYSAWAKVRRTRYFYGSTQVAGSSFEYHGNAVAILKGRIVAFVLIVLYNIAFEISDLVGLLTIAALLVVAPWLIWRSLQFKLYNTSYRGIRFGFRGEAKGIYTVFLLWPALAMITLYLTAPFAHQRIKKYQHEQSRFGATHFSFDGTVGRFYIAYLIVFAIWLAGIVAISVTLGGALFAAIAGGLDRESASGAGSVTIFTFLLALYAWMFILIPIFATLIQNLIWNHTQLGPHRFTSEMKWPRMAFIAVTNIIGIICTLGLFLPFATIRAMKYRVESMTLLPDGSLDHFIAAEQEQVSATGEGMADLLDFDLSL